MRKSELKQAVKNAIKIYYKSGLTNTAYTVQQSILIAIDKAYKQKHKQKN